MRGSERQHHVGEPVRVQRVALVRKKTALDAQARHPDAKLARALASHDPIADRVRLAHDEHQQCTATVEAELRRAGVQVRIVDGFSRRDAQWADLVVTVGGDGTFLRASHHVDAGIHGDGVPMLAVNSAVSSSVGWFCAATATDFAEVLGDVLAGRLRSRGLWRMQVRINGRPLRDLALNDVLLAHRVPAETTRYELRLLGATQDQRSSGIWISTPAGSTAAIRSAGGSVMDLEARALQFRVRELMGWAVQGKPIAGGVFHDGLVAVSRMATGMLYLDGNHRRVAFGFGDRIEFRCAERPMPWIAPRELDQRRARAMAG